MPGGRKPVKIRAKLGHRRVPRLTMNPNADPSVRDSSQFDDLWWGDDIFVAVDQVWRPGLFLRLMSVRRRRTTSLAPDTSSDSRNQIIRDLAIAWRHHLLCE